jgi:hypothetical protein
MRAQSHVREYFADSLPERRLGAFGVDPIFCGFLLQSLQYWLALLASFFRSFCTISTGPNYFVSPLRFSDDNSVNLWGY